MFLYIFYVVWPHLADMNRKFGGNDMMKKVKGDLYKDTRLDRRKVEIVISITF